MENDRGVATPEDVMRATAEAMRAVGAMLDTAARLPAADARALAVARTQIETGFLWTANAVNGGSIF